MILGFDFRKIFKKKFMKQQLTNHFIFVLDASGSMKHLESTVVKVTDEQVKELKKTSKKLGQESRISIYTFDYHNNIKNIVFDMDVERFETSSGFFKTNGGQTALLDSIGKAYSDAKSISQMYSDHAFLMNILTDGIENDSRKENSTSIKALLNNLPPNWTVGILVPSQTAKFQLSNLGFPKDNIQVWETTERGYEEGGQIVTQALSNYMVGRSTGIRGSSNLFQTKAANLTPTDVRKASQVLGKDLYQTLIVTNIITPKTWISDFVTNQLGSYKLGKAFYQLTKPEKIQPQKSILLRNKKTKEVFHGLYTRQLINLPDYEVKVSPGDHGDWDIFVQSTSINRHIVPNTDLIILK